MHNASDMQKTRIYLYIAKNNLQIKIKNTFIIASEVNKNKLFKIVKLNALKTIKHYCKKVEDI